MIKIAIDDKIPYIRDVLEPFGKVHYLTGSGFTNDSLKDIDALIIRTRTQCNARLLKNTNIKFIATATIGFDHIDTGYCAENNIFWTNAPGCNAGSVAQYIASALANLSVKLSMNLNKKTLGIVGVGHVGKRVIQVAESFGMRILLNDPPRQRMEGKSNFVDLDTIKKESDIISFHVPLHLSGKDKTYGLVDEEFLKSCNPQAIIINTSRGELVNSIHLKHAIKNRKIGGAILDVWENEPDIDTGLLSQVIFGTPHIAGYGADGKANATAQVVHALSNYYGFGLENWYPKHIPSPECNQVSLDKKPHGILVEAINQVYDIKADAKKLLANPGQFELIRNTYPVRRDFNFYTIKKTGLNKTEQLILGKMNFTLS